MDTYLDGIVAWHRRRVNEDDRDLRTMLRASERVESRPSFGEALRALGVGVIAEIKRRSPSKGPLGGDIDPASLSVDYGVGGAAAISVLTDEPHFGGSLLDLRVVSDNVWLPILRKDFLLSARDLVDAKCAGASAVLLIVAALSAEELVDLAGVARDLALDVLIEIHSSQEIPIVPDATGAIIGVNQRDLATFVVDRKRALRIRSELPEECVAVAESGITGPDDVSELGEGGFSAVLVGELLMVSDDPIFTLSSLVAAGRDVRQNLRNY
ncbi:MAG: indole-3-glycerol phosphate synthase TrpC [Ferrimicrobium sp.]